MRLHTLINDTGSSSKDIKVNDSDISTSRSKSSSFVIKARILVAKYDVYLSDSVESNSSNYIDLIHYLTSEVESSDIVMLHLANFGGSVHSGTRLIHAIRETAAHVHVVVEAPSYSMGAILAVSGDSMEMKPGTFLMFHNYSASDRGKGGELTDSVTERNKYVHGIFEYAASPFLTKKEINLLKDDKDVYIHYDAPDLAKRCKRHFGNLNKLEVKI